MSCVVEYRRLERLLAEKLKRLEALQNSVEYLLEVEFNEKLLRLLREYNFSVEHLMQILRSGEVAAEYFNLKVADVASGDAGVMGVSSSQGALLEWPAEYSSIGEGFKLMLLQ